MWCCLLTGILFSFELSVNKNTVSLWFLLLTLGVHLLVNIHPPRSISSHSCLLMLLLCLLASDFSVSFHPASLSALSYFLLSWFSFSLIAEDFGLGLCWSYLWTCIHSPPRFLLHCLLLTGDLHSTHLCWRASRSAHPLPHRQLPSVFRIPAVLHCMGDKLQTP